MNKLLSFIFLLILVSGCGQGKSDYVITIKTKYGDMTAILYDETPLHKANFIKLAEKKFFDSLLFHRVIQGFMIQGGDPDSKKLKPGQQLGGGGPGYTVPAEFNQKFFHEKGALSAARQGDNINPKKESSGSQFYIVHGTVLKQTDLDGLKYDQNKLMAGLSQMSQNRLHAPLFDSLQQLYASGDMQAYQSFCVLAGVILKYTQSHLPTKRKNLICIQPKIHEPQISSCALPYRFSEHDYFQRAGGYRDRGRLHH